MPARNRTSATIQLAPKRDADLIKWLERIPPGGRNAALKNTLRCGLELPIPVPQTDSIQKLESEVQTMREAMSRLPKQQPGMGVDNSRVDELERMIVNVQDWMNSINRQLASLMTGAPIESLPILEAAPELTLEDRQNRANKLKKAKW